MIRSSRIGGTTSLDLPLRGVCTAHHRKSDEHRQPTGDRTWGPHRVDVQRAVCTNSAVRLAHSVGYGVSSTSQSPESPQGRRTWSSTRRSPRWKACHRTWFQGMCWSRLAGVNPADTSQPVHSSQS